MYLTGYFANAKVSEYERSKVHVVDGNKKPICGSNIPGDFQFCAHGVQWDYVECERCKTIAAREMWSAMDPEIKKRKPKDKTDNKIEGRQIKKCTHCAALVGKLAFGKVFVAGPSGHDEYYIYCKNCGAQGPTGLDKQDAVNMWNMRRKVFPGKEQ